MPRFDSTVARMLSMPIDIWDDYSQGGIERCWSSDQVTNLCICDNGVR